jgi:hypothetical protein
MYTLLIVAFIPLLNGPLFCSQDLFLSLFYPLPIQGHPIPIPIHYYVYSLPCILF